MPPFLFLGGNKIDGCAVQRNCDWPLVANLDTPSRGVLPASKTLQE
jgi:hypothetical protein